MLVQSCKKLVYWTNGLGKNHSLRSFPKIIRKSYNHKYFLFYSGISNSKIIKNLKSSIPCFGFKTSYFHGSSHPSFSYWYLSDNFVSLSNSFLVVDSTMVVVLNCYMNGRHIVGDCPQPAPISVIPIFSTTIYLFLKCHHF